MWWSALPPAAGDRWASYFMMWCCLSGGNDAFKRSHANITIAVSGLFKRPQNAARMPCGRNILSLHAAAGSSCRRGENPADNIPGVPRSATIRDPNGSTKVRRTYNEIIEPHKPRSAAKMENLPQLYRSNMGQFHRALLVHDMILASSLY